MMASRGLAGTWGQRTENDESRSVDRWSKTQAVASRLFYQDKRSAADVANMDPNEWNATYNASGIVDQREAVQQLRALENYKPTP